MTCAVPNCKNIRRLTDPESGVTYHRFPKGERFNVFKKIIGVPSLQWGPRKFICSEHFLNTDFILRKRRILKNEAIPSKNLGNTEDFHTFSEISFPLKKEVDDSPDSVTEYDHKNGILKPSVLSEDSVTSSFSENKLADNFEEVPCNPGVFSSSNSALMTGFRNPALDESHDTSFSGIPNNIRESISFIRAIHSYSLNPGKERKRIFEAKKRCKKYVDALYRTKKKVKQLQREVTSLQQVINFLKSKGVSVSGLDQLQ